MIKETSDYGHCVIDNELEDTAFTRKQNRSIESMESQIQDISTNEDYLNIQDNTIISDSKKSKIENQSSALKQKTLNYYKKTQHWTGVITKINSKQKIFYAKLIDKNSGGTYEIAEFDFDEISTSDFSLVKKGAIFYYSLGYASNNGQIKKEAFLRFKRSVPFDAEEVDSIEDRVNKFNQNINWE